MITYANAPLGTMTAAGSAEMFAVIVAAGEDPSVRVIVITGGIPGIFIRHYDVGELSDAAEAIQGGAPRASVVRSSTAGLPRAHGHGCSSREAGHRSDQRPVHGRWL